MTRAHRDLNLAVDVAGDERAIGVLECRGLHGGDRLAPVRVELAGPRCVLGGPVMPLIEIPQGCLSNFLTLGACQRSG